MSNNSNNFLGLEKELSSYKNSKITIIPIPYEQTTTYLTGTKKAPRAIIKASKHLELYDEELDKCVSDVGISTLAEFKTKEKPEKMVHQVKDHCLKVINDNKFPVVIGGEHSISIGFFHALKEKYSNLSVLQLDAHADLRDAYEGSKYNHACIMARIREHADAVQVGIRSVSPKEAKLIKSKKYKIIWSDSNLSKKEIIDKILNSLSGNVFLSIDTDAFDPSIVRSVGTPEPGGMGWHDMLAITKAVFKNKNVVGFDVMELSPKVDDTASDFTAAKLIYKLLGYKFFINN